MNIIFTKRAENNLVKIINYISEQGYPDTANHFLSRTDDFIKTLKTFPDKFAICKQASLKKRSFRCVPFENNFIVVYKHMNDDILIYNFVHASKFR